LTLRASRESGWINGGLSAFPLEAVVCVQQRPGELRPYFWKQ
jgi:hypothetical protein